MESRISVRNYRPEDAQALAEIYFNTIHRINIKDYTQEQVDVWAPESSLEEEGWKKKFLRTNPIVAVVGGVTKLLDLLNLNPMVISIAFIVIMSGLAKGLVSL